MRAFRRKSRGVQVTREEALKSTPVKSAEVKEERLETGEILLTYPVTIRPWIASLARRLGGDANRVQLKRIHLCELGTTVWDLMDGRRSVRRVIQGFARKYQLHIKEAEVAVSRYLRELGKRGLIGLK
jgi:hypothetical protein